MYAFASSIDVMLFLPYSCLCTNIPSNVFSTRYTKRNIVLFIITDIIERSEQRANISMLRDDDQGSPRLGL